MTELHLYQTIHLARGRARNMAAHVALLNDTARELFGFEYRPDTAHLAARIEALAAAERYPTEVSGFIRLELGADGQERLRPAGVSLYDGYALRSISPKGVTLRYDYPLSEAPTPVREATTALAHHLAAQAGGGCAVRYDADGTLREADGAPLFAICGHTVRTAPRTTGVERSLVMRAVERAGLEMREEAVSRDELAQINELFYVDHRGITPLSHCDGMPLMMLLSERIAAALEALFPKK